MLLTHITIAILSVVQASVALALPSRQKLQAVYVLIAATLTTGTYLVVQTHASLVSSCVSGLLYLVVVLGLSAAAQYRLAKVTA